MAEVRLSRAEAEGGELPAVCMQCGQPATADAARKYSTDQMDIPPPFGFEGGPLGCIFLPIWVVLALCKLFSWSTATTMTVTTPLCDHHARSWFAWSTLEPKSIDENSIVLSGVSQEFAQLWNHRIAAKQAQAPREVKIRCRSCLALNDENAHFCNQCAAQL